MTGAPSLRLFLAVTPPDEHLAWVGDRIAELRDAWPEARWIPPENQHITLRFLGNTPEGVLDEIVAVSGEVALAHPATPVTLSDLGAFPSPGRARVLWIGVDDPGRVLSSLAGDLDQRLAGAGFEPESRPFSPHLTVARFKRPTRLHDLPAIGSPSGAFSVDSFGLWRSRLSPRGARYERLASFPLG